MLLKSTIDSINFVGIIRWRDLLVKQLKNFMTWQVKYSNLWLETMDLIASASPTSLPIMKQLILMSILTTFISLISMQKMVSHTELINLLQFSTFLQLWSYVNRWEWLLTSFIFAEHLTPLLDQITKLEHALFNIQYEQHWLEAQTERQAIGTSHITMRFYWFNFLTCSNV